MVKPYLYLRKHSFLTGKDEQRVEHLRLLVENELLVMRDDFSLCKNDIGQVFYLHKDDILKFSPYVLNASEIEAFEEKIASLKMNASIITPQDVGLKNNIVRTIKEYIPERRKEKRKDEEPFPWKKVSAVLFFVLAISYAVWFILKPTSASIQIEANKSFKRVYVNNKLTHIENNSLVDLDTGLYSIKLVFSDNSVQEKILKINSFDVYSLSFVNTNMAQDTKEETGIFVETNEDDFVVVVDSINHSTDGLIVTTPGSHTIKVIKKGYDSEPAFRSVFLTKGEKSRVPFKFIRKNVIAKQSQSTISVSTNYVDALIYMNGKKAPSLGNFTYRGLDRGRYRIQVIKNGYTSFPKEKTIDITTLEDRFNVSFNLQKTSGNISITTLNSLGEIFLNGKSVGKGQISTVMEKGSYRITFSDIEGFVTPNAQTIDLNVGNERNIIVKYLPKINYSGEFKHNAFKSSIFEAHFGYVKNLTFQKGGDRKIELLRDGARFSYPFNYNNPSAGHAVKFNFMMPNTFESSQKIYLTLTYQLEDETYSISNTVNPEVSFIVNNKRSLMSNRLKDTKLRLEVNRLLIQGENEILLFLTENNNVPILFKSIELSYE